MKCIWIICVFLGAIMPALAQNQQSGGINQRPGINRKYVPDAIEEGNFLINAGAGFFSVFSASQIDGYREEIPPLYLSADYALSDGMSVGGYVAYSTFKQTMRNAKITALLAGPRLAYRIFVNEDWDIYASLLFGIVNFQARTIDTNQNIPLDRSFAPFYGTMLGARYYFTNSLAVNAEIGWGLTLLNAGLTYRISKKQ
jgi:hypothetical protein